MKVTKQLMESARTVNNGFTMAQVRHAQTRFDGAWKRKLQKSNVPQAFWDEFVRLGTLSKKLGIDIVKKKKSKVSKKILNPFSASKKDDWSWSPTEKDTPVAKFKKTKTKKGKVRKLISRKDNADFYNSKEWRAVRVRVLEKFNCSCMMCGRSPREHKIVIHVDHIKPRSKYPELSLDFNNLQLLCEDCNMGKSNKYDTDHRPETEDEQFENEMAFEANKYI